MEIQYRFRTVGRAFGVGGVGPDIIDIAFGQIGQVGREDSGSRTAHHFLGVVFHGGIVVDSVGEASFGIRRFPGIGNRAFHGCPPVGNAFVADRASGHFRQDHLRLEAGFIGAVIDTQVVDGVSPDIIRLVGLQVGSRGGVGAFFIDRGSQFGEGIVQGRHRGSGIDKASFGIGRRTGIGDFRMEDRRVHLDVGYLEHVHAWKRFFGGLRLDGDLLAAIVRGDMHRGGVFPAFELFPVYGQDKRLGCSGTEFARGLADRLDPVGCRGDFPLQGIGSVVENVERTGHIGFGNPEVQFGDVVGISVHHAQGRRKLFNLDIAFGLDTGFDCHFDIRQFYIPGLGNGQPVVPAFQFGELELTLAAGDGFGSGGI